jgi:hypothetical protein
MGRKLLIVTALALAHYMAATLAVAVAFSGSMDAFDTGRPLSAAARLAGVVAEVLMFPGYNISTKIGIGWLRPLHDLISVANSLLWGGALYLLGLALFRRAGRRGARET